MGEKFSNTINCRPLPSVITTSYLLIGQTTSIIASHGGSTTYNLLNESRRKGSQAEVWAKSPPRLLAHPGPEFESHSRFLGFSQALGAT